MKKRKKKLLCAADSTRTGYARPTMVVDGKQRLVSRVVMERHLGRTLQSDELVHHINHDPFDNRIENLRVVSRADHKREHLDIGKATRLQKIYHFDAERLKEQYRSYSITELAAIYGCHDRTISRALTQFGLRSSRRRS
jgi:hypothetical protein